MKHFFQWLIRIIALFLGAFLLYKTIGVVDWADFIGLVYKMKFWILIPLLVYPVACMFHAQGLRVLIPSVNSKRVGYPAIYLVRMMGDALNKITPFVDIGGDPLKAYWLHQRNLTSLPNAITAVWTSRISFVVSEVLFVLLGLCLLQIHYPSDIITQVIQIGIIISLVYISLLLLGQMKGAINIIPKLSRLLDRRKAQSEESDVWVEVDRTLKGFYKTRIGDMFQSTFWQFWGWFFAIFEVWFFFKILGHDISFTKALIFQSLLQALKTATFMIPANIGAQEGGLVYLAIHLGFSPAEGFLLSLMKRLRQGVWVLFGFLLWFVFWRKPKQV